MAGQFLRPWGQFKPPVGWGINPSAAADLGIAEAFLFNENAGGIAHPLTNSLNYLNQTTAGNWGSVGLLEGIRINGVSGGECVGRSPPQFATGGNMTFSCRVVFNSLVTSLGEYEGLVGLGTTADMIASLSIKGASGDTPVWEVQNSSGSYQSTGGTATITTGTVYDIVGIVRGTTIELWINGVLSSSASYTGTPKNSSASYSLGVGRDFFNVVGSSLFINGVIQQAVVCNRAWTPDQIRRQWESPFWWMQGPRTSRTDQGTPPPPPSGIGFRTLSLRHGFRPQIAV